MHAHRQHRSRMTLPFSWTQLLHRTWRDAIDDDVLGLAAQLSYYFFLALFPAILFVLALASFFPLGNVTDDVGRSLGPLVSPQVLALIQEQMRRLAENQNGGVLTVGVAGALGALRSGRFNRRCAEPRLRHRGATAVVEGQAGRHRADARHRGDRSDRLIVGSLALLSRRSWDN